MRTRCNIGEYRFDAEGDEATVTRLFNGWSAWVESRLRLEAEEDIRRARERIGALKRQLALLRTPR